MPWCDSFEDGFAPAVEGDRPSFRSCWHPRNPQSAASCWGYPWLSALLREIHWGAISRLKCCPTRTVTWPGQLGATTLMCGAARAVDSRQVVGGVHHRYVA